MFFEIHFQTMAGGRPRPSLWKKFRADVENKFFQKWNPGCFRNLNPRDVLEFFWRMSWKIFGEDVKIQHPVKFFKNWNPRCFSKSISRRWPAAVLGQVSGKSLEGMPFLHFPKFRPLRIQDGRDVKTSL